MAIALTALFLAAGSSDAQTELNGFRFHGYSGELSGSFQDAWLRRGGWWQTTSLRRQALRLKVLGSFLHPDVVSFLVEGAPSWSQFERSQPGADSIRFERDRDGLMGRVQLDLFRRSLLGGSFFARRNRAQARSVLGADEHLVASEWGVDLWDRNRLMPARLYYSDRHERRETFGWALGGRDLFDDRTSYLRYAAENSKTSVNLERVSVRRSWDAGPDAFGNEERLTQRTATLQHRLVWGHGSQLTSRLRYMDRASPIMFRNLNWDESATLVQSARIRSGLGAGLARNWTPSGVAGSVRGRYTVTYQPTRSATLALGAYGRSAEFRDVRSTTYELGPTARLSLSLPAGARLSSTLGSRYRWNRRSGGSGLFADVIREPHIPGVDGVFVIDRPFVDLSSIVVLSGAGDRVYEEGFDYRVFQIGSSVQIHILPGGRIQEGDELLVDYRYELRAGGSEQLLLRYDVGLVMGALSLRATRSREESVGAGAVLPPDAIRILDRSDLNASLSHTVGPFTVGATVGAGTDRRDDMKARSRTASARLGVRLAPNVSSATSASYRESANEEVLQIRRRAEQMIRWRLHRAINATGSATWWNWRQDGFAEEFFTVSALLELGRASRRVKLRYDYVNWDTGQSHRSHRLGVEVSQAFGRG